MANRAYLCCSSLDRTYPSFRNRRYRPELHTLAGARDGVPLLWLALFVPSDLRTDELLDEDGEDLGTLAPVARRADALDRLDKAVARLEKAYPRIGPLSEHAIFFRRMLKSTRGKFVTVELEEIAWLARSQRVFDERLRRALGYIAGRKAVRIARTLTAITGVDPGKRLVPPKELFDRSRPTKLDLVACMRVVGTSHIREVPWEQVPSRPTSRKPRAPKLHYQLHDALASGNEKAALELIERGANPNAVVNCELAMQYVAWGRVGLNVGRALVKAGYDLSKRNQGYTVLHRAIDHDRVDVVQAQLDLGASATHEDGFGRTPLALAACRGAPKCVQFFLQLGPDTRAVKRAIRQAEVRLKKPQVPPRPTEQTRRMREAIEVLRAHLASHCG